MTRSGVLGGFRRAAIRADGIGEAVHEADGRRRLQVMLGFGRVERWVRPELVLLTDGRGELDLDPSIDGKVDRIGFVEAAETVGNRPEGVFDHVLGERALQVLGHHGGQRAIVPAQENAARHVMAPEAMERDHGAHMTAERAKPGGLLRAETRRRNVPSETLWLTDDVERRAAARGGFDCDVIGILLEVAAVKGHDAEARA